MGTAVGRDAGSSVCEVGTVGGTVFFVKLSICFVLFVEPHEGLEKVILKVSSGHLKKSSLKRGMTFRQVIF